MAAPKKAIAKKPKASKGKAAKPKAAKGKASKGKKDDKPKVKRAPGPYMIFCKAERPKIVKANPNMPFGEVGKALGARWKAFSAEEKAPFEAKAKEAKEKYQEAMKAYEAE